jgi:hypothetical protein
MEPTDRLSNITRGLTWLSALGFAMLGLVLFVVPGWAATRFAWNVSPLVTMTIGGWCLGTAGMAWLAAREWRWSAAYAALLYLWSFAALELAVLVWFRDSLRLDVALGAPYLGTLAVASAAALFGVVDVIRLRSTLEAAPSTAVLPPWWIRAMLGVFVAFLALLVAVAAVNSEGMRSPTVFPEPLSPFTLRAFGAFYLALIIGSVPLIWARSMPPVLAFFWGGVALLLPIAAAAFTFWDRFDFGSHPAQLIYIGSYLVALGAVIAVVVWARARPGQPVER